MTLDACQATGCSGLLGSEVRPGRTYNWLVIKVTQTSRNAITTCWKKWSFFHGVLSMLLCRYVAIAHWHLLDKRARGTVKHLTGHLDGPWPERDRSKSETFTVNPLLFQKGLVCMKHFNQLGELNREGPGKLIYFPQNASRLSVYVCLYSTLINKILYSIFFLAHFLPIL